MIEKRLWRAVKRNSFSWYSAEFGSGIPVLKFDVMSATSLRDLKMVAASTKPPNVTRTPPTSNVPCFSSGRNDPSSCLTSSAAPFLPVLVGTRA